MCEQIPLQEILYLESWKYHKSDIVMYGSLDLNLQLQSQRDKASQSEARDKRVILLTTAPF